MRIWTGWGAMVPLSVIAAMLLTHMIGLASGVSADVGAPWATAAGGLMAGAGIHLLSRRAERFADGQGAGTFFFLPTRHWRFIVPAMTLLMALGLSTPGGVAR